MKSYVCSVSLRHEGCFSESSERFPDLRMAVIEARIVNHLLYFNRMAFFCPDRRYFEAYVRRLGAHPNIRELRVLHGFRAGDAFVGIADIYAKNASRSIRRVLTSLGKDAVVHPNIEHSGIENVSITTGERSGIKDFYGRISGACEVLRMRKGEFKEDRFRRELEKEIALSLMRQSEEFEYLFSLTGRQKQAVKAACSFKGVRGAKMRKMADSMGVAPSTFRQHLDSGLFKLMPLFSRIAYSVPSED